MPSTFLARCRPLMLVAATGALLALPGAPAWGYSFGAGTCDAYANSNFMAWKTHHPGADGGFALSFPTPDYYVGETLAVTLGHSGSELLIGFLVYPETGVGFRRGTFTPIDGSTLSGGLPNDCAHYGHTITHDLTPIAPRLRSRLSLAWTAPAFPEDLTFRALVLRADPMAETGTDFYEVSASLPVSPDGIFRNRFDSIP